MRNPVFSTHLCSASGVFRKKTGFVCQGVARRTNLLGMRSFHFTGADDRAAEKLPHARRDHHETLRRRARGERRFVQHDVPNQRAEERG